MPRKKTLSKSEFMSIVENEGSWEYIATSYGYENLLDALEADVDTKRSLANALSDVSTGVKRLVSITDGWLEGDYDAP